MRRVTAILRVAWQVLLVVLVIVVYLIPALAMLVGFYVLVGAAFLSMLGSPL